MNVLVKATRVFESPSIYIYIYRTPPYEDDQDSTFVGLDVDASLQLASPAVDFGSSFCSAFLI